MQFILIGGIRHHFINIKNADRFNAQAVHEGVHHFIQQAVLVRFRKRHTAGSIGNRQSKTPKNLPVHIFRQKQGIGFLTVDEAASCIGGNENRQKNTERNNDNKRNPRKKLSQPQGLRADILLEQARIINKFLDSNDKS